MYYRHTILAAFALCASFHIVSASTPNPVQASVVKHFKVVISPVGENKLKAGHNRLSSTFDQYIENTSPESSVGMNIGMEMFCNTDITRYVRHIGIFKIPDFSAIRNLQYYY